MQHRRSGLVTLLALLGACTRAPVGLACPDILRPAIIVRISDSTSGLGAAYTASLVLQGMALYDSLDLDASRGVTPASDSTAPRTVSSQSQRPGTYTVRVRRSGYALWERNGIVVPAEPCGPATVVLDVRLQRT
jgi:hypothetical protein